MSLIGCFIVAMFLCRKMGVSTAACLFAAVALFGSRALIYNYLNPYMTDTTTRLALVIIVMRYREYESRSQSRWREPSVFSHTRIVVVLVPTVL